MKKMIIILFLFVSIGYSQFSGWLGWEGYIPQISYIIPTPASVGAIDGLVYDFYRQSEHGTVWNSGTVIIDYGGFDHNGAITGGMDTSGTLLHSAALLFDAVDDFITHDRISFVATDAWLVNTWINLVVGNVMAYFGDNTITCTYGRIDATGLVSYREYDATINEFAYMLTENQWTLISLYYDGSGSLSLYVNGILSETLSIGTTQASFNGFGNGFRLDNLEYLFEGYGGGHSIYKWTSDYAGIENLILTIYDRTHLFYQ